MVIVRCIGPGEFFLERVVFPFEVLSFLAPLQSTVQIWSHGLGGAELVEALSVEELNPDAAPDPDSAAPAARTHPTAKAAASAPAVGEPRCRKDEKQVA